MLDSALISAYRRDGAVRLASAFGPEWVEKIKTAVEKVMKDPSPNGEFCKVKKLLSQN